MSNINTFVTWANSVSILDLMPVRDLISVSSDASLYDVLNQLKTHDVHSLPVVNDKTKLCVGMVDVLDIVCEIYDIANFSRFNKDGHFDAGDIASSFIDSSNLKHQLNSLIASMMIQCSEPQSAEVIAALPAYFDGPKIPSQHVTENDTLTTVLSKLGFDARHRVPVVSALNEGTSGNLTCERHHDSTVGIKMVGLICQSDLLKFFAANLDKLPAATLDMKLSEFPKKILWKVGRHSAMAEVLWHFKSQKMLSLIVEEYDGGFLAPLSADDFISCAHDLAIYGLAVDEFLLLKEKQKTEFKVTRESGESAVTDPSMMLKDAIKVMAGNHYSRLWLADPKAKSPNTHKPIVHSVITIRDILLIIWKLIPGNERRMLFQD